MTHLMVFNFDRKAIEVIEAHKPSKPLFLYLAFQAAHMKVQKPPKKYLNLYRKNGKIQQIYQDELIIEEGQEEQALYRAAAISVRKSKESLIFQLFNKITFFIAQGEHYFPGHGYWSTEDCECFENG